MSPVWSFKLYPGGKELNWEKIRLRIDYSPLRTISLLDVPVSDQDDDNHLVGCPRWWGAASLPSMLNTDEVPDSRLLRSRSIRFSLLASIIRKL